MTPAFISLVFLGVVWIGFGSVWLLANRRYRLEQTPRFLMDLLGFPVEYSQHLFGRKGVPYALLLPNMVLFGTFTFVPMILNSYTALTGGYSIDIFQRPFVGLANFSKIFDCASYLDLRTCGNEGFRFWSGMLNTVFFVLIQVPVICAVSLVTALVLNRDIRGRGFWRAVFFYPVMLSPVVIANIWILHRKGVLNQSLQSANQSFAGVANQPGFDAVITVVLAILLIVTSARTLRAGRDPSLTWGALFGLLFLAVFAWARPLVMITPEADDLNIVVGLLLVGTLFWAIVRGHASLGFIVIGLSILAAALLLTIQFDAVFDLGRFRPVNWLVIPNTGWPFF